MSTVRYSFGPFTLDTPARILAKAGAPVRLGQRALSLLLMLVEARGELVTREDLMARVWPGQAIDDGAIRVHLSAARKALAVDGMSAIVAEAGRGYRLALPVVAEPVGPSSRSVSPPFHPPRSLMPARVANVIGRDAVVASLADELASRRFVSIVGPGGIGKTTAGIAVVRRVLEVTSRSGWFVDLAPIEDGAMIVSTLATTLDVPAPGPAPEAHVAAWLAANPGIVLLDNCEHVVDAAAALAERLLQAAPDLLILATSREPLRGEGEWVHRLAPLDVPATAEGGDVAGAAACSAVALFAERATAANDRFRLDSANIAAVIEVCRRLDGLPLAIELAAARVDSMSPATIAAGLDDRFALLSRGRRTALPRHRTLRGVLDWSYDLLEPAAADLLDRLSLFRNGFDHTGAAAMGAGAGQTDGTVAMLMAELVAKSLVVATPAAALPYRLLDTTRHYGLERLAGADAMGAASRDHARFLLRRLGDSAAAWEGKAQRDWLAGYSAQIDDVRGAIAWAGGATGATGDAALATELVIAAAPLWFHLSLPGEFLAHAERAIALIHEGNVREDRQVELLSAYGHSLWHTRGPVQAMAEAFRQGLALAEALGSAQLVLRAQWGLWAQSILDGRYGESLALAQRFDAGVDPTGALADRQTAAHMLALSHHFLGDHDKAGTMLEVVVAGDAAPERANHANHAQVDGKIAVMSLMMRLHWMRGDLAGALALARDCAAEAERLDHALSSCYGLAIGCIPVAIAAGETSLARAWVTALGARTRRHGLDHWHAFVTGYGAVLDMPGTIPAQVTGMQAEMFAVAADPDAVVPWRRHAA